MHVGASLTYLVYTQMIEYRFYHVSVSGIYEVDYILWWLPKHRPSLEMARLFVLHRTLRHGLLLDLISLLNHTSAAKMCKEVFKLPNSDCTGVLWQQLISLRCCALRSLRRADSNETVTIATPYSTILLLTEPPLLPNKFKTLHATTLTTDNWTRIRVINKASHH